MIWKRIKRLIIVEEEEVEEADEAPPPAPVKVAEPAPLTTEAKLAQLAEQDDAPDASFSVQLFDELRQAGKAARAIDLARKILQHHPTLATLSLRVAEALAERGDDDGAWDLLQPLIRKDDLLPALMLAAEIADRRGASEDALALYERVLARDLDFPRARARVERLRQGANPAGNLAGATIVTDGALARGRFRVESELGRGGAGTVFAARDLRVARRVALKVYHRRGPLDRERLAAEARTPAALEHPGVIRIFDVDVRLGAIAMEWVRGGSVRAELSRGAVDRGRVHAWLASTLDALQFVHESGFVHRDLKPSNLLLRENDQAVLTDFGIATPIGVTRSGGEGTLQYMPQEQRDGAAAQPSADVFAFGAMVRELSLFLDEVPDSWREWAAACTRKDATKRPSIADLKTEWG